MYIMAHGFTNSWPWSSIVMPLPMNITDGSHVLLWYSFFRVFPRWDMWSSLGSTCGYVRPSCDVDQMIGEHRLQFGTGLYRTCYKLQPKGTTFSLYRA
jgi:hypothetical protein